MSISFGVRQKMNKQHVLTAQYLFTEKFIISYKSNVQAATFKFL